MDAFDLISLEKASQGVRGANAERDPPVASVGMLDFLTSSKIPDGKVPSTIAGCRQPFSFGGNGKKTDKAWPPKKRAQGIAPALLPEIAPFPAAEIRLAGLGPVQVNQLDRSAEVVQLPATAGRDSCPTHRASVANVLRSPAL